MNTIPQAGEKTVSIPLPSAAVANLRAQAARHGLTLEAYLQQLAERKSESNDATSVVDIPLTDEVFNRLLDELRIDSPVSHLPVDFSRADIYSDHD